MVSPEGWSPNPLPLYSEASPIIVNGDNSQESVERIAASEPGPRHGEGPGVCKRHSQGIDTYVGNRVEKLAVLAAPTCWQSKRASAGAAQPSLSLPQRSQPPHPGQDRQR